jgi:hypothetical protein
MGMAERQRGLGDKMSLTRPRPEQIPEGRGPWARTQELLNGGYYHLRSRALLHCLQLVKTRTSTLQASISDLGSNGHRLAFILFTRNSPSIVVGVWIVCFRTLKDDVIESQFQFNFVPLWTGVVHRHGRGSARKMIETFWRHSKSCALPCQQRLKSLNPRITKLLFRDYLPEVIVSARLSTARMCQSGEPT